MLEFKIIQELKPNEELLEIIKNYNYTIKNGKIKHLTDTNLQSIDSQLRMIKEYCEKKNYDIVDVYNSIKKINQ